MSQVGKHTKGPWRVVQDTLGSVADANGMTVAQAAQTKPIHCREDHNERLANASLIAAAPDLLAALESAMRIETLWCPVTGDSDEEASALVAMREMFVAAIAKARGVPQ
jgi:hypothetical protein